VVIASESRRLKRGAPPLFRLRFDRQGFFDCALQLFHRSRFGNSRDDRLVLHNHLSSVWMAGNEHDGNSLFPNNLGSREAIDDRHIKIDERHVHFKVRALLDQFIAIANSDYNLVAEAFEQPDERSTNVGLVFGHCNPNYRNIVFGHTLFQSVPRQTPVEDRIAAIILRGQ
jgi:hypothetical protein